MMKIVSQISPEKIKRLGLILPELTNLLNSGKGPLIERLHVDEGQEQL